MTIVQDGQLKSLKYIDETVKQLFNFDEKQAFNRFSMFLID